MRHARAALAAVVVVLGLLAVLPASAHDVRPGALALRELEPGRYGVRVTPPMDGGRGQIDLLPELPGACAYQVDGVTCDGDLAGTLTIPALAERRVKVMVHVQWLDGARFEALLREGESTVDVTRPAADAPPPSASALASDWFVLGVEHIVFGYDHLLFVLGLALVARRLGRVALAITGFTVAHSVTLVSAALGWVVAPSASVELIIAASILLLAHEAATDRDTLTRRMPWAVALGFGLIHGFGFAGAIGDLGLPREHTLVALLTFNLGVEVGQLAVLAVALLVAWITTRLTRSPWPARLRVASAWAIGLVAGVWTIDRAARWFIDLV